MNLSAALEKSVGMMGWILLAVVLPVGKPARSADLAPEVRAALLRSDWEGVRKSVSATPGTTLTPMSRFALGHAFLALNDENDSLTRFVSATAADDQAWQTWTEPLSKENPSSAVARYLCRAGTFDA